MTALLWLALGIVIGAVAMTALAALIVWRVMYL